MLRITVYEDRDEIRLTLEGKVSGPWAAELWRCWSGSANASRKRKALVDLTEVDFIDADGRAILSQIRRDGARLIAATPFMQAALKDIERTCRCGTVKNKPSKHDVAPADTPGRHPSAL